MPNFRTKLSGRQLTGDLEISLTLKDCNFASNFRHVWLSWGKRFSVQHDSYLCKMFRGSIGFPTQRQMVPNNFVASIYKDNDTLTKRCPIDCRRYREWEYC